MGKLIVVSNRLPITVVKRKGELKFQPSVGGLATGVGSLDMSHEQLWVGWPGIILGRIKDEEKEVRARLESQGFYPVFLSRGDITARCINS